MKTARGNTFPGRSVFDAHRGRAKSALASSGDKGGNERGRTVVLRHPRYEGPPHLHDVRWQVLEHVGIVLPSVIDRHAHALAAHELEHADGWVGSERPCRHLGDEM